MENMIISSYKEPLGVLSSDRVFHIHMRKSENWVKYHGWPIDALGLYIAKEAGAESISVHDDETWEVWAADIQTIEEEGYESTPYPSGAIYMFLPAEYWEVTGMEGC